LKPTDGLLAVMAGLVPAIHVFTIAMLQDVDARHKAGHDETGIQRSWIWYCR
jgi:hypothetical protein